MDPYTQGKMGMPLNTGDREPTFSDQSLHAQGRAQSMVPAATGPSALAEVGEEMGRNAGALLVQHPAEYFRRLVVYPITVGLIAAGAAFVLGGQPVLIGAEVGGGLFAILALYTILVLAGLAAIGLFGGVFLTVGFVFSLWRWYLALGALGAGLGYLLASTAKHPTATIQQTAITYGLAGLGAGVVIGTCFRLLRRLSRRLHA